MSAIDSGRIVKAYPHAVKQYLSDYMGLIFEKMCQDYLLYYADKLPIELNEIGQWWGTDSRSMALLGAELLFYPTAIGSEPTLNIDSKSHWQHAMQGHAAANIMPVIASNRIGTETDDESSMTFYGSSFIADQTGTIVEEADRETESVLVHEFDLDAIAQMRREWGVFRDRRPEMYGTLMHH